jgi:hypothetical protein
MSKNLNSPDNLAKEVFLLVEKPKCMQGTLDHLSYYQYGLNEHEHLRILPFPWKKNKIKFKVAKSKERKIIFDGQQNAQQT